MRKFKSSIAEECFAAKTKPQSVENLLLESSDACLERKIAETRKISPDALIRNDVLEEWEQECKAGK
jgi:hypothetical protein